MPINPSIMIGAKEESDLLKRLFQSVKAEVFKKVTRSSKSINFAIISANGIKKLIYSEDLISATVTLADLFQQED